MDTAHRLVIFPQRSRIPGRRQRWYVRLVSTLNGRTILVSEAYAQRSNAERAANDLAHIYGLPVVVEGPSR